MPRSLRARDERVEVLHRAQLGVDRVVAALGRADGPRRADVAGPGVHGVVAALAVRGADGVDRGQVDDVEAHGRDAVELLGRGDERAVHRAAGLVAPAGGAGEELVPGAELGAHPVDVDLQRPTARDQLADRALGHDRVHGREQGGRDPGVQRQRGVAQRVGRAEEQVAVRALGRAAAHPLQQPGADLQVVGELLGGLARVELLGDGVAPRGPGVAPRVDAEASTAPARRRRRRPRSGRCRAPSAPCGRGGRGRGCRPCATRRWRRRRRAPRARPWPRSG